MQAGVTSNLTKIVDLGASYTVGSPNVIITLPDGTNAPTGTPTVSPSITTLANPHSFSFLYTPPKGGFYTGYYEFIVAGQTLKIPFQFWTCWTDLYDGIRLLLGMSKTNLPDRRIDIEFYGLFTEMYAYTKTALGEYYNLSSQTQIIFDHGMTKLLAARLRPSLGGKQSTGEVSLFKKGTTTIQYTNGSPAYPVSLEEQWEEEGYAILSILIPSIGEAFRKDHYQDETMTRGKIMRVDEFAYDTTQGFPRGLHRRFGYGLTGNWI